MLNKLTGGGPKKARGGDETYAADLGQFNEMHDRVKAIDVALVTYEKKVAAVAPALRIISQAFTGLYTDPSYADHATSFDSSYQTVNGAIAAFQTQQAETRKILADYLIRLKALSKAIDQHDALYSEMVNKEKAAQKAKPKEAAVAQEKASAAKDAYTVKHQEVSRDLHELVENKYEDLELVFSSVVSSQQKLFSQMSNSFEGHGLSNKSKTASSVTNTPRAAPAIPAASPPPPVSYHAPPPASQSAPPVPVQSIPPPIPQQSAPPAIPVQSYSAPPIPTAHSPPVPVADPYGAPPSLPSQSSAPPLPVSSGPPPLPGQTPAPVSPHGGKKQKLAIVSAIEREKFEALFAREEAKEGKGVLNGEFVFDMFSRSG